jgi:hypothetical protein
MSIIKFLVASLCIFNVSGFYLLSTSNDNTKKIKSEVPKFVQEAELKHGRVAMVSSLIIPSLELLNGNNPGINVLSSQPVNFQLSMLAVFACSEAAQLLKAYEYPYDLKTWFNMKESHVPGEYNFDPLKLSNTTTSYTFYKEGELLNGRIAMLAATGMITQELCTDKTIIDTFKLF